MLIVNVLFVHMAGGIFSKQIYRCTPCTLFICTLKYEGRYGVRLKYHMITYSTLYFVPRKYEESTSSVRGRKLGGWLTRILLFTTVLQVKSAKRRQNLVVCVICGSNNWFD